MARTGLPVNLSVLRMRERAGGGAANTTLFQINDFYVLFMEIPFILGWICQVILWIVSLKLINFRSLSITNQFL